ncbi:MAG: hypothetical protein ACT4P4_09685 [Betaproteobacteria bacterium]
MTPGRRVTLRSAATAFHLASGGRERFSMRGPEYVLALNLAARDLALKTAVYRRNLYAGKTYIPVPRDELAAGAFEDGGNLFRTAEGIVYKHLYIDAAEVLDHLSYAADARRTNRSTSSSTGA